MSNRQEHIIYLWQQFADKKATRAEIDALFEYFNDPALDEVSLNFLQHQFNATVAGEGVDKEYWLNKLTAIVNEDIVPVVAIQAEPAVHRVHIMKRGWFRVAAAAVILAIIATTAILIINNSKDHQTLTNSNKQLTDEVLPGRERAILTLANGEAILLDSTQGNIVQQGDFTIVNLNGQLDYKGKDNEVQYHTLSIPKGGQYKLQLADGTDVWLNAASSITYPTAFTSSDRKVTVTGEAYFEVAKDKTKPFKVNVDNKSEVEVLGTHFNINSYGDDGGVKTTHLEGRVKVSQTVGGDKSEGKLALGGSVTLKPGQQSNIAANSEGIFVHTNVDVDKVMAWKNGLFNFEKADLKTVMAQLERWYDIEVKYEGAIPPRIFRGKITRDLNLSQVIKGLSDIEIKFRIEGRTLVVMN